MTWWKTWIQLSCAEKRVWTNESLTKSTFRFPVQRWIIIKLTMINGTFRTKKEIIRNLPFMVAARRPPGPRSKSLGHGPFGLLAHARTLVLSVARHWRLNSKFFVIRKVFKECRTKQYCWKWCHFQLTIICAVLCHVNPKSPELGRARAVWPSPASQEDSTCTITRRPSCPFQHYWPWRAFHGHPPARCGAAIYIYCTFWGG